MANPTKAMMIERIRALIPSLRLTGLIAEEDFKHLEDDNFVKKMSLKNVREVYKQVESVTSLVIQESEKRGMKEPEKNIFEAYKTLADEGFFKILAEKSEKREKKTVKKKEPVALAEAKVKTVKKKEEVPELKPLVTEVVTKVPDSIVVPDEEGKPQTYMLDTELNSFEKIQNFFTENGAEALALGFVWTKKDLKQYGYSMPDFSAPPKAFKNDVDTAQFVFIGDKIAYAVSDETEAYYTILPGDFEEVFESGVRIAGLAPFGLYVKAELKK